MSIIIPSVTAAGGGDSKLGTSHASRASGCFPDGGAEGEAQEHKEKED